jgi:hypothetical protein
MAEVPLVATPLPCCYQCSTRQASTITIIATLNLGDTDNMPCLIVDRERHFDLRNIQNIYPRVTLLITFYMGVFTDESTGNA